MHRIRVKKHQAPAKRAARAQPFRSHYVTFLAGDLAAAALSGQARSGLHSSHKPAPQVLAATARARPVWVRPGTPPVVCGRHKRLPCCAGRRVGCLRAGMAVQAQHAPQSALAIARGRDDERRRAGAPGSFYGRGWRRLGAGWCRRGGSRGRQGTPCGRPGQPRRASSDGRRRGGGRAGPSLIRRRFHGQVANGAALAGTAFYAGHPPSLSPP